MSRLVLLSISSCRILLWAVGLCRLARNAHRFSGSSFQLAITKILTLTGPQTAFHTRRRTLYHVTIVFVRLNVHAIIAEVKLMAAHDIAVAVLVILVARDLLGVCVEATTVDFAYPTVALGLSGCCVFVGSRCAY